MKISTAFGILVTAAVCWLGLVVLAPFAAAREEWWAQLVYSFFRPLCHQLPDRSFHWLGHPLAVCHRCTGLYVGFLAGLLLAGSAARFRSFLAARPRIITLFALPLVVDVFLPNSPLSRFSTGLLAASPIAFFVWLALDQLSDRFHGRMTQPRREETNGSE